LTDVETEMVAKERQVRVFMLACRSDMAV